MVKSDYERKEEEQMKSNVGRMSAIEGGDAAVNGFFSLTELRGSWPQKGAGELLQQQEGTLQQAEASI